ncbi:MAG: hypothetical protein AAFZ52_07320, partial [Bacteroidota bacterium]
PKAMHYLPLFLSLLLGLVLATSGRAQVTQRKDRPQVRPDPALRGEAFRQPPNFRRSPLGVPHYGPARQASTKVAGPRSSDCEVQVRDFAESLGKEVGTSPWHMVSAARYPSPTTATIWGATLTDAYRFLVDGDRFEALDRFPLNYFPSSITWNLFSTDDGRVVVPDASGYRIAGQPRRSTDPSWLVLKDGNGAPDQSKIELVDLLEFTPRELRQLLRPPVGSRFGRSIAAGGSVPTYTGEIATTVSYLQDEERLTYLVVVDLDEMELIAGGLIGKGLKSNEIAAEPFGEHGTAMYVPLDESVVKVVYNGRTRQVTRHWEAKLPVRRRTGTTPTLVNTSDGRKFVCVIDSKCAVASVVNGLISCSEDERPSQLVAVERDAPAGRRPRILTTELPDWLRTVENSPAAYGDRIVVANYSGYLPNGLYVPPGGHIENEDNLAAWMVSPDARVDFARGIVALRYDIRKRDFVIDWADEGHQVSCIPTISAGANMVYGVGAEEDNGDYWLYGFRLKNESPHRKGSLALRVKLGKAPFRMARNDAAGNLIFPRDDYQLKAGEVFDAGNQIILLNDGSLIISGGRSLVRVQER